MEEIEQRQEELMAEARHNEVFDHKHRTLDMAKMSVNNSSRNSKVTLPSQLNNEQ